MCLAEAEWDNKDHRSILYYAFFFNVVCILVAELVPASVRTTLSLYTDYARACFNSSSSKSQLQTAEEVAELPSPLSKQLESVIEFSCQEKFAIKDVFQVLEVAGHKMDWWKMIVV